MKQGDRDGARACWKEISALTRLLFAEPSPAPAKYWLARRGVVGSAGGGPAGGGGGPHADGGGEPGARGVAGRGNRAAQATAVAPRVEHDPEKWVPVFRKEHAQIKEIERDDVSKKSHPALACNRLPLVSMARGRNRIS